jgi:hypothetical protein
VKSRAALINLNKNKSLDAAGTRTQFLWSCSRHPSRYIDSITVVPTIIR